MKITCHLPPSQLLKIQARLNQYLLQSARSLFDDMQNIDLLITKIMTFTKELVSADRCSLFLVDQVRCVQFHVGNSVGVRSSFLAKRLLPKLDDLLFNLRPVIANLSQSKVHNELPVTLADF
ncbi:hypothetical protein DPMN_104403 [Dreissena polymorpha]|uniref:Uncharacterized protein n=1 Tax=Dreissena polymorpha TaxID=45954 RepID=A0A9D4K141_DREPO|nr:hypothetical protein DPMN_104403 [Dreissena polymorpha]